MNKVIDLTGKLSVEDRKEIERITPLMKEKYVLWLEKMGKEGNKDKTVYWWALQITSRNTFSSDFFLDMCFLCLIEAAFKRGEDIEVIKVKNSGLGKCIEKILPEKYKHVKVMYTATYKESLYNFFRLGKHSIDHILKYLIAFVAGIIYGRTNIISTQENVLLDTFVLPGSFVEDKFMDRYYTGLLDLLGEEQRKHFYFFPHVIGNLREYFVLHKKVRKNDCKIILREDFYTLSDYAFAFAGVGLVRFNIPKKMYFEDVDVTALLRSYIKKEVYSLSLIRPLLEYRIAKRLEEGIHVRLVINWFENQTITKCFNLGLKKFCPTTKRHGYMGYPIPENFLSLLPTEQEFKSDVLPEKIFVIGKGYIEMLKKSTDVLKIEMTQALRQSSFIDNICITDNNNILVVLPYFYDESMEIINAISKVNEATGRMYNYFIKIHPVYSERNYKICSNLGENIIFSNENVRLLLGKTFLTVTGASTAALESIISARPVVICPSYFSVNISYIPDDVDKRMVKKCYTEDEMIEAISFYYKNRFVNQEVYQRIANETRNRYFAIGDKYSIESFVN